MLLNLREYHRIAPQETQQAALDQALALLARRNIRTVPLAGGSSLVGSSDPTVEAVVDLQGLGLEAIRLEDGLLRVGAMATRSALAQDENAGQVYGGLLGRAAHLWGGSVQRNRATVGGAIAVAAADDPLVAALLVCDARLTLYTSDGYRELSLVDFLPRRSEWLDSPAVIIEVETLTPAANAGSGLATVARTPADNPIVLAAVVLQTQALRCTGARLALGGVAPTAVRLAEVEAMLEGQPLSGELVRSAAERVDSMIDPPSDFRGSAEYRRAMARVLSERALRQAATIDDRR